MIKKGYSFKVQRPDEEFALEVTPFGECRIEVLTSNGEQKQSVFIKKARESLVIDSFTQI